MEYTKEMIEKAKTAESAEALQALAKENGIEMSAEEAEVCFTELHPQSGELSDEELENVSGGGCRKDGYLVVTSLYSCDKFRCSQYDIRTKWPMHDGCYECKKSECKEAMRVCMYCICCKIEKGLWLCKNPDK